MEDKLKCYREHLDETELSEATRKIYYREAGNFLTYMEGRVISKKETLAYKKYLFSLGRKMTSNNLYIVAVNHYLKFAGYDRCIIKTQRLQRRQCPDNILDIEEYRKLMDYALKSGRKKYYCIMRTLALTGIRISELSGCTVESLEHGKFTVNNKGRTREVYLPDKLIYELKEYCREKEIRKGIIFMGTTGRPISRAAVYKMLHHMADMVGIPMNKVHPHSFRHLFALTYMEQYSNLFELADILGHSSLETTRIYTATTGEEKRRKMENLRL